MMDRHLQEQYLARLKDGLDSRLLAVRVAGSPGPLLVMPCSECGYERANSRALDMNFDALDAWIDEPMGLVYPETQPLRAAFMQLDSDHAQRLSGGSTTGGIRQWAKAEADKLQMLLQLLRRLRRRWPTGSRSVKVQRLKAHVLASDPAISRSRDLVSS